MQKNVVVAILVAPQTYRRFSAMRRDLHISEDKMLDLMITVWDSIMREVLEDATPE